MADAQASGACYGNIVWVQVPSPASSFWKCLRKCRNWQTSKTKDLVLATACGFKSHLPHEKRESEDSLFSFLIIIIIIQQIIRFLWNGSSAGMSVRLTRERSWVRTPSVPRSRRPAEILTASKVRYLCGFLSSHEP